MMFAEYSLYFVIFMLGFMISGIVHIALFTRLVRKIIDLEPKTIKAQ